MSKDGYKIRDQGAIHFSSHYVVTFSVVEWIDVFSRSKYADIIVESLKYCQLEKGMQIYAWCIMSNHIHLIIKSKEENLSDLIRDFKKHTSKEIIQTIEENKQESRRDWMLWLFKSAGEKNKRNKNYQFWRQDNHPIQLDTNEMIDQRLNYIHINPVNAKLVYRPEDYVYSSASAYSGREALIDIEFIQ